MINKPKKAKKNDRLKKYSCVVYKIKFEGIICLFFSLSGFYIHENAADEGVTVLLLRFPLHFLLACFVD